MTLEGFYDLRSIFLFIIAGDYRLRDSDFVQIYQTLKSGAYRWRDIGMAIGFKATELDMIESNPMLLTQGPPLSFLSHMLSYWLQWAPGDGRGSDSYATYGNLSAALWKANMGALAANLPQGIFVICNPYSFELVLCELYHSMLG